MPDTAANDIPSSGRVGAQSVDPVDRERDHERSIDPGRHLAPGDRTAMSDPVDELYVLPASEFVAARDRLARKLTAAKQRERAREIKALPRPNVAAWVVNQLAHKHGAVLRRLIDAGETLRRAQRRVVRGGDADELRTAATRRQDVLRELRRSAAAILGTAGSGAHLDAVLATLEAASIDPAAAKAVSAGRLSRELPRPSGFGEASQLSLVVSRRTTPPAPPVRTARKSTAARAAESRRQARELIVEAKRLEREAVRSEQAAARAAKQTASLERARHKHLGRVEQLREELTAAERQAREAAAEVARARAEAARAAEHASQLRRRAETTRARADVGDRT